MKKMQSMIFWLFYVLFLLSARSTNSAAESISLDTIAAESEMTITSSDTQVSQLAAKNKDFTTWYEPDECYNITPDFVVNNSDYGVFKYSNYHFNVFALDCFLDLPDSARGKRLSAAMRGHILQKAVLSRYYR